MTFAEHTELSVSDPRVLVEIDIGFFNTQWVNNGAGLWAVAAENVYSWVDSTLVEEGFSAQSFGHIGSVQRDGITLTEVYTLAALTDATDSWYYDPDNELLWVCLTSYDAPELHDITVGVVYGYSFDEFTPAGIPPGPFEARLLDVPRISIAKDPLYYGILGFGGGTISLANADGFFDTFASDNELYGNAVRIYLGYDELAYADYERIYTGLVESFRVNWERAEFDVVDKRKNILDVAVSFSAGSAPPLSRLETVISGFYPNFPYTDDFWDTDAFDAARIGTTIYSVTYDTSNLLNDNSRKPMADFIAEMVTAAFSTFFITPDGRFTANTVDHTATTSGTIIRSEDILNEYTVKYDPTEVISSVRVGHTRTYTTTQTIYLYYRDTTHEASVYTSYKTYKEHVVELPLSSTAVSILWATKFMSIHDHVRGELEVEVPVKYYATEVGTEVLIEVNRPTSAMIGTVISEITSKSWNLNGVPTLTFGVKFL